MIGTGDSGEIRRQVHQVRTHGLLSVIQDVNLLLRHIAFVHIIELKHGLIQQQVAHLDRILARIISEITLNHTCHRKVERLF